MRKEKYSRKKSIARHVIITKKGKGYVSLRSLEGISKRRLMKIQK